jgi:hypothetical protein
MEYDDLANSELILLDDVNGTHLIDGVPYYANMPQQSIEYVAPALDASSLDAYRKFN